MEPPSPELIERCRAVATSTWSDVLDGLHTPGAIQGLTLRSGAGAIAGVALTVRETVEPLGTFPVQAFDVGRFIDAITPGVVLVIDMAGEAVSTFGGLAAQAAVARAVAGVVIDGACRDVADIRASELWLASRHLTPLSGKRRVRVDDINVPITMCGIPVNPGDIIVADATGIVCIGAGRVGTALPIAEELTAHDATFGDALRDGRTFTETAARLRHL